MLSQRSLAAGYKKALPSDDEFNRVSFMSHFDGANSGNNSVYDDSSTSNHTITQNGRVWQGSFGPFARPEGEWSNYFDGSDSLTTPDSADWDFGSGTYTVEAWVFPTALGTYQPIVNHWGDFNGNNTAWSLILDNANKWAFYFKSNNGSYLAGVGTAIDASGLNQWYHLAAVRNGNAHTLYVNGTAYGTVITDAGTIHNCTDVLRIGALHASYNWTGNISNVRVVKGTAVYTGNFTPSSSPLTAITNTKLLTCQSNRFVDNSASPHTITPAGDASISAFGPFLTDAAYDPAVNGASAFFAGADSDLVVADNSDVVATGDYTLDVWLYPTNNVQRTHNPSIYRSGTTQLYMVPSGNPLRWYADGVDIQSSSLDLNSWNHVAAVRSGTGSNNVSLYVNGVRKGQGTNTGTMGSSSNNRIGSYSGTTGEYDGYICDMRLLVGTALYSGTTYTIPTAPLTAITNTKLLLNMANGQIIDNAAQSIAREVGSPVISTAQAKFGDTSLSVSGSSSVKFNEYGYSGFAFSTGDFTIEFWYYGDSTQNDYLFDTRLANDNEARASVYFNSNSKLSYYTSNTTRITSTTALTNNTWTHIALVRSSAVTRFYFNGTQDNQSFSDTLNMPSAQLVIGSKWNGTQFVTGYFDDFRISNMARYTSNFTAPSAPFPDKGQ